MSSHELLDLVLAADRHVVVARDWCHVMRRGGDPFDLATAQAMVCEALRIRGRAQRAVATAARFN